MSSNSRGNQDSMQKRPRATRRPHKKSREGCGHCRQRRIKCGEERPSCDNCLYSCLECNFITGSTRDSARGPRISSEVSQLQKPSPTSQDSPVSGVDLDSPKQLHSSLADLSSISVSASPTFVITLMDLELLHHFSTNTYLTFGRTVEGSQVWQIYAPKLSLSHLFLLRGLLSMAALHLSYLRPQQCVLYREQALVHYEGALKEYHVILGAINESNLHAAYLFASLLVAYNFALTFMDPLKSTNNHALSTIQDTLLLVRRTGAVLGPFRAMVQESELKSLLVDYQQLQAVYSERTSVELDALSVACTGTTDSRDDVAAEAYLGAIKELKLISNKVQTAIAYDRRPDIALVMVWLINIPEVYMKMLDLRTPEALVILAYFATIMHQHTDIWWLRGWNLFTISVIDTQLSHEWKKWLTWPKSICNRLDRDREAPY